MGKRSVGPPFWTSLFIIFCWGAPPSFFYSYPLPPICERFFPNKGRRVSPNPFFPFPFSAPSLKHFHCLPDIVRPPPSKFPLLDGSSSLPHEVHGEPESFILFSAPFFLPPRVFRVRTVAFGQARASPRFFSLVNSLFFLQLPWPNLFPLVDIPPRIRLQLRLLLSL